MDRRSVIALLAAAVAGCGGGGEPAPPAQVAVQTPAPAPVGIAFWGDSLTQPVWMDIVSTALPGREIYNGAVGGQTSAQIAARQGGVVPLFTLAGDTIPPSGGVAITARSVSPLTDQDGRPLPGSIAGVPGLLSRAADDTYTFTRAAAGATVAVPPQSPFTVDTEGRHAWINVFWIGNNNAGDPATVMADIAACVALLEGAPKKFVIVSLINGSASPKGSAAYANITGINADLAALYPGAYLDVRTHLVNAFDPSSAQDVADFSNDLVPSSLRGDAIHLNTRGNQLVGEKLAEFLLPKGW